MNRLQLNNNDEIELMMHMNLQHNNNPIDLFWWMINDINWYEISKEDNATEMITEYLMTNYTVDEIINLQQIQNQMQCEMEDFINSYLNSLPLKERSTYKLDNMETIDLASHIVGLGRTMFNYVKDNPTMLFNLQNEYKTYFGDAFDNAIYELNTIESETNFS